MPTTTLDQAQANIAALGARIAEAKAAMPSVQAALSKALLEIPGVPEACARDAVASAQAGRRTVTIATIDLANSGMDISARIAAKEKLIQTGLVRP
jgi:hypothetical protein